MRPVPATGGSLTPGYHPVVDFLLHAPACSRGRPSGSRRLDVQPDYGAFPVWGWFTLPARAGRPAREVHGQLGARHLGLTGDLAAALQDWADWQSAHQRGPDLRSMQNAPPATEEDWRAWRERGRRLADRLAAETGAAVVCLWPSQGRDPGCPECGPDRSAGS